MELKKTDMAKKDLQRLPDEVNDTFDSKADDVQRNLNIGLDPDQCFNKRLSGNMHPILQMNLGRDYRAWFIESSRLNIDWFEENTIYCIMILTKKEQQKLTPKIRDPLKFIQNRLQS